MPSKTDAAHGNRHNRDARSQTSDPASSGKSRSGRSTPRLAPSEEPPPRAPVAVLAELLAELDKDRSDRSLYLSNQADSTSNP